MKIFYVLMFQMSYPDFNQQVADHQSLLVVIKPVGSQLRQKTFSKVYEQIVKLTEVQIPEQQRTIHVRYKANYPVENSEWGDFQVSGNFFKESF